LITTPSARESAKMAAARAALGYIKEGMVIGLGTGSTTAFFIQFLIEKIQKTGLAVKAVATSENSYKQAQGGKVPLVDVNRLVQLDMTVDGADEIDGRKRMIKGGGGALMREKIVASMSREMIVIVDNDKLVEHLGKCRLPVEVLPFAHLATLDKIRTLGFDASLRLTDKGNIYITDNGNYIADVAFENECFPERDHALISAIPGVLETGFFLNLAGRVFVGHPDGHVDLIQ